MANHWLFKKQ